MLIPVQTTLPSMGLGKRIKARLDELEGVSVADLANACGVTPSAVYQWMSGDTKGMKPENLVNCCRALKVHIAWLVFERGPKERAISRGDLSPDEEELITAFKKLDEPQQRAMVHTLTSLARARKKKAG
jgi:transcriptional regulator with XRE-family HTH domain